LGLLSKIVRVDVWTFRFIKLSAFIPQVADSGVLARARTFVISANEIDDVINSINPNEG